MHWLVLHCPALALEVFARQPTRAPLAVVESGETRETVVACDAAARQAGVRPGMRRSAAHARVPQLCLVPRDPAAERQALTRIAAIALGFSDHVAVEPPLEVLLEVGASRRLFGGFDRLLRELAAALAELGWTVVQGLAPTPAAARLLAVQGGGRIDDPERLAPALDACSWDTPALDRATAKRLSGWGIRTLGECRALPRSGAAERLGPAFRAWLDRLYGERSEAVPRYEPPGRFEAVLPLPTTETAQLDLPLRALERLTRECEAWLRTRDAGLERFAIDLYPPRGRRSSVHVGLVSPGREADHLLALARERLEGVDLPEAIVAVGLRGGRPLTYTPAAAELWTQDRPSGAAAEPPQHLLERLRARLGFEAVGGLILQADHRPERASAWSAPGAVPLHEPERPPSRPLWLFPEPAPLALDRQGRPQCDGLLELLDGPERIETGWWDGDDVERDYFVARTPAGSMLWIYRERRVPQRWFAHGLFG